MERKRTGYRLARKVIQEQAGDHDSEPEETQDPEEVARNDLSHGDLVGGVCIRRAGF
jgi:hypothetical protein